MSCMTASQRMSRTKVVESDLQAELRENPGFLLAQSARIMRDKLSGALSSTGLSLQQLTLLRLLASAESMNQQELGSACNLDKTTITELIDTLEQAGFAKRRVNRADRRAKKITLTPAGKRVLGKATKLAAQAEEDFLRLFSEREWSTVRRCLTRYLEANDS